MEYPKKSWCLYFSPNSDFGNPKDMNSLSYYHGCIGYEIDRNEKFVTIKIHENNGFRKEPCPKGDVIQVPVEQLKTGFISKYHIKYLESILKKVEPNTYLENEKEVWLLYSIFGYYEFLDKLIKYNGIVNDKLIEEIADEAEIHWMLTRQNRGYCLQNFYQVEGFIVMGEDLTTLETMKRYGLRRMDTVYERTQCIIPLAEERDRKLKQLL